MKTTIATFLIAFAVGAMGFNPASAQERRQIPEFRSFGEPGDNAEAGSLDEFLAAFRQAWAAQDTEDLMALHADDAEWINAYARIFRGTEALGNFLEHRLFPHFDPSVSSMEMANLTPISVRYLGDDVIVLHLYTDGNRGPSRTEGHELRRTHLHLILEWQESDWQIVHTAIMDAR